MKPLKTLILAITLCTTTAFVSSLFAQTAPPTSSDGTQQSNGCCSGKDAKKKGKKKDKAAKDSEGAEQKPQ